VQRNRRNALVAVRVLAQVKWVAVVSKVKNPVLVLLGLIQKFIDEKKLDGKAITEDSLVESGLIRRKLDGIRVLAKGEITAKVSIEVTGASKGAVEAVEKAGGKLTIKAAVAAE